MADDEVGISLRKDKDVPVAKDECLGEFVFAGRISCVTPTHLYYGDIQVPIVWFTSTIFHCSAKDLNLIKFSKSQTVLFIHTFEDTYHAVGFAKPVGALGGPLQSSAVKEEYAYFYFDPCREVSKMFVKENNFYIGPIKAIGRRLNEIAWCGQRALDHSMMYVFAEWPKVVGKDNTVSLAHAGECEFSALYIVDRLEGECMKNGSSFSFVQPLRGGYFRVYFKGWRNILGYRCRRRLPDAVCVQPDQRVGGKAGEFVLKNADQTRFKIVELPDRVLQVEIPDEEYLGRVQRMESSRKNEHIVPLGPSCLNYEELGCDKRLNQLWLFDGDKTYLRFLHVEGEGNERMPTSTFTLPKKQLLTKGATKGL